MLTVAGYILALEWGTGLLALISTAISAIVATTVGYLSYRSAQQQRRVEEKQVTQGHDLDEQRLITDGMRELINLLKDERKDLREQLSKCTGDCAVIKSDNERLSGELNELRAEHAVLNANFRAHEETILWLQERGQEGPQ